MKSLSSYLAWKALMEKQFGRMIYAAAVAPKPQMEVASHE